MNLLNIDQLLFSLPDVIAAVGTNIYAMLLPDEGTYPSIAYMVKSLVPQNPGVQTAGITRLHLECDAFAKDYATANIVRQALLTDLVGWSGSVDGVAVQNVQLVDAADSFENEILLFRLTAEFAVFF